MLCVRACWCMFMILCVRACMQTCRSDGVCPCLRLFMFVFVRMCLFVTVRVRVCMYTRACVLLGCSNKQILKLHSFGFSGSSLAAVSFPTAVNNYKQLLRGDMTDSAKRHSIPLDLMWIF